MSLFFQQNPTPPFIGFWCALQIICTYLKSKSLNLRFFEYKILIYLTYWGIFYADYPTASQYVTSVGATIFKSKNGHTVTQESGASLKNGAIITTGGGFAAVTIFFYPLVI